MTRTLPELLTRLRFPADGRASGVELGTVPESNPAAFWARGPGTTITVTPEEKALLEDAGATVTISFGTMTLPVAPPPA